jgi:XTP/dITP diphosphohydrolase
MARVFSEHKLVIATHNKGKLVEIAELLKPYNVECISAGDLNLPEPEETGDTFVANATLKAHAASRASGLVALADDSGLEVDALDGAPGVYSARWAGESKDFSIAMQRVQDELRNSKNRKARFICALALCWPDSDCEVVEGKVEGKITWPPKGDKGFGYDPIFMPDGSLKTFAEMDPAAKHKISHRARAFNQLIKLCFSK